MATEKKVTDVFSTEIVSKTNQKKKHEQMEVLGLIFFYLSY